jgi:hypothetical protein
VGIDSGSPLRGFASIDSHARLYALPAWGILVIRSEENLAIARNGSLSKVLEPPPLPDDMDPELWDRLTMWSGPIGSSVHALFWATVLDFDHATKTQARWLSRLQNQWDRLLPGTPWRPHTADECLEAFQPLLTSPSNRWRPDLFRVSDPSKPYFGPSGALRDPRYEQVVADRAGAIVLDNDVRAVFHAAVASALDQVAGHSSATVRYVGGGLRTPVQLVLAQLAKDSLAEDGGLAVEDWMQLVSMPFWFDAVVSGLDTPDRLPERIRAFRRLAAPFRARRRELECHLVGGNRQVTERLAAALAGDAAVLTKQTSESVGAAMALADVALRIAAPTPVGISQVGKGISGAIGSDRTAGLTMRLFHPELRVVHKLGRSAELLSNSLPRAFSLFELERAEATAPLAFLNRLGDSTATVN